MYAIFVGGGLIYTHDSQILLVGKILILFFKLGQAQRYGIESYQKNTDMNIPYVGDKKLMSFLLTKLYNTE